MVAAANTVYGDLPIVGGVPVDEHLQRSALALGCVDEEWLLGFILDLPAYSQAEMDWRDRVQSMYGTFQHDRKAFQYLYIVRHDLHELYAPGTDIVPTAVELPASTPPTVTEYGRVQQPTAAGEQGPPPHGWRRWSGRGEVRPNRTL